jgi:hypothetical protein
VDILSNVAQALLKAGQGGSGGDLCLLLVDVFEKAEMKPDAGSKGKLLACLRLFDKEEPTRKKFIGAMLGYVTMDRLYRHGLHWERPRGIIVHIIMSR